MSQSKLSAHACLQLVQDSALLCSRTVLPPPYSLPNFCLYPAPENRRHPREIVNSAQPCLLLNVQVPTVQLVDPIVHKLPPKHDVSSASFPRNTAPYPVRPQSPP